LEWAFFPANKEMDKAIVPLLSRVGPSFLWSVRGSVAASQ
jgi:hypothetical protein